MGENGMKTGLNNCLVIIASQTKMEIVRIIAQWIVVKICFAQEKWIPRVARCLIHVFQENFVLLSVTGKRIEDWTEQMSGDYCIPNKNGDCWNTCPMDCGKDTICPGGMDPKGCPMPDTCMPAGNECPKM